jgi:Protein of unknown function (DUF1097)
VVVAVLSRHAVDQVVNLSPLIAGALSAAGLAAATVLAFSGLLGLWVWAAFVGWASYDHSGANRKALLTSSICMVFGVVMAGWSRSSWREAWSQSQARLHRRSRLGSPRS